MAKKTTPKKKAAVKKTQAPKKGAIKKKLTTKKAKTKNTCIIVKYDCGYDNHLTIRGAGAGLSWHKGVSLKNVSANEWIFEVMIPDEFLEFKVLINDQVFELGDNHKIKNGDKIEIHPSFH